MIAKLESEMCKLRRDYLSSASKEVKDMEPLLASEKLKFQVQKKCA
jgi:hypothetical protein